MPKITYVENNGTEHLVEVPSGPTVMQVALGNDIPGIDAVCGGGCACATCHVYVDEAWQDRIGGPSSDEASMLELAMDVRPNSRLSCQIVVTDALDGAVFHLPTNQQ